METRVLKIDENTKLDRLDKVLAEKLDFYGATLSVIDGFDISTVSFSCLNKYIYY